MASNADQSEATEVCEFRVNITTFSKCLQLAAPLRRHSTRKVFLEVFFLYKKVKNISEIGVK